MITSHDPFFPEIHFYNTLRNLENRFEDSGGNGHIPGLEARIKSKDHTKRGNNYVAPSYHTYKTGKQQRPFSGNGCQRNDKRVYRNIPSRPQFGGKKHGLDFQWRHLQKLYSK
jgi:hypothetical protein